MVQMAIREMLLKRPSKWIRIERLDVREKNGQHLLAFFSGHT